MSWRYLDIPSIRNMTVAGTYTGIWVGRQIAGSTKASAQCFDEPNGNVRLLAFEQRRALIGNQQLLTGDQRSQGPAHTAFVFSHRIFPAPECILLSTFLERDLISH